MFIQTHLSHASATWVHMGYVIHPMPWESLQNRYDNTYTWWCDYPHGPSSFWACNYVIYDYIMTNSMVYKYHVTILSYKWYTNIYNSITNLFQHLFVGNSWGIYVGHDSQYR